MLKKKKFGHEGLGEYRLILYVRNRIQGAASLKTSRFVGPEGNHEVSPVRKRVRLPYLMYICYKLLNTAKEKKELLKLKLH
jgi:hypothetical protein